MTTPSPDTADIELRKKLIEFDNRGELSDEEHLKAFQELEAYITKRDDKVALAARIDELSAAINMKGKTLAFGADIIDTSKFEGGRPDLIDSAILEKRLKALQNNQADEGSSNDG